MGRKLPMRLNILAAVIVLAAFTHLLLSFYDNERINRMEERQQALEAFCTSHQPELVSKDSIAEEYNAFTNGTHYCQLMCYGRMKAYSFNNKEFRCVCSTSFVDED